MIVFCPYHVFGLFSFNEFLALKWPFIGQPDNPIVIQILSVIRAVVKGGAGSALAPPEFGSSVNPIPTRGGTLCPSHYC